MIIKNPTTGATEVMLVRPSRRQVDDLDAGRHPEGHGGADVGLRAARDGPGSVHALKGGVQRLATAYTLPEGATLSFVEKGNGVQRTLETNVDGKPCPGAKERPDGRTVLCDTLDFQPSAGPGGKREIVAVVERDGLPLSQETVASFTASAPKAPATPKRLRMVRFAKWVVAAWDKNGADQYSVSVVTASGQKYGRLIPGTCRSIALPISGGEAVRVSVAGVRYDLTTGARNRGALATAQKRSGASPTLPRKQWVKRTACR